MALLQQGTVSTAFAKCTARLCGTGGFDSFPSSEAGGPSKFATFRAGVSGLGPEPNSQNPGPTQEALKARLRARTLRFDPRNKCSV